MKRLVLQNRRLIAEVLNALLAALALAISFLLRFDFTLEAPYRALLFAALPLLVATKLSVFRLFELQHLAWRYIGFADFLKIARANAVASLAAAVVLRLMLGTAFPRSLYFIDLVVCLTLVVAARAAIKLLLERRVGVHSRAARRILIYGAGMAGVTVLREIRSSRGLGLRVIGFLDDDPAKHRMQIHGVRVIGGRTDLTAMVRKHKVDQVLLALPRASGPELTAILEECHVANVEAKRIPALTELMDDKVLVEQIREVRLEDLLGRAAVTWSEGEIRACIRGRVVLVTGAGGSIGSELCRQIARFSPLGLVGLDQAETPLYHIEQELNEAFPNLAFYPEIASIQNRRRLEEVFRDHRPHLVFHAAAYKHVPLMESHLFEAVENNVFGTANVARCAVASGAEDFVLVSSDKAVRPTNVMGATKRLAEMVCLASQEPGRSQDPGPGTRFMAVRFGNVLGSNGSVIPRFRQQIAAGGPVTVTHPDMRRYFMTIPEAVQLVLQAAAMGEGGEIFVLEMGEPVKIVDLARKMVLLSGLRPDRDIRIVFSGVRPGEKMYEEICTSEEDTVPTPHSQIRIFSGPRTSQRKMHLALREMRRATDARDAAGLVVCLQDAVADYTPSSRVLRQTLESPARRVVA